MLCLCAYGIPSNKGVSCHRKPVDSARQIHPDRLGVRRGPVATVSERLVIVRQPCPRSVFSDPFHGFADEVREGRERDQLAGREQVGKRPESVVGRLEIAGVVWKGHLWLPGRRLQFVGEGVMHFRSEINPASASISHNRHEASAQPSRPPLGSEVREGHRGTRE